MPAEREEVVVDADPLRAEDFGEDPAEGYLPGGFRARYFALLASGRGSRERSSFPFAVNGMAGRVTTADGTM